MSPEMSPPVAGSSVFDGDAAVFCGPGWTSSIVLYVDNGGGVNPELDRESS